MQPNWNEAPEWAQWWVRSALGHGRYYENKPRIVKAAVPMWRAEGRSAPDGYEPEKGRSDWMESPTQRPTN